MDSQEFLLEMFGKLVSSKTGEILLKAMDRGEVDLRKVCPLPDVQEKIRPWHL